MRQLLERLEVSETVDSFTYQKARKIRTHLTEPQRRALAEIMQGEQSLWNLQRKTREALEEAGCVKQGVLTELGIIVAQMVISQGSKRNR